MGNTKSDLRSGCKLLSAEMVAGVIFATPKELSSLEALRSWPHRIFFKAALTTQSERSECETDGILKQGPSTVPGAETKLNTALNKFMGEGLRTALSKSRATLVSSLNQQARADSFHVDVE